MMITPSAEPAYMPGSDIISALSDIAGSFDTLDASEGLRVRRLLARLQEYKGAKATANFDAIWRRLERALADDAATTDVDALRAQIFAELRKIQRLSA